MNKGKMNGLVVLYENEINRVKEALRKVAGWDLPWVVREWAEEGLGSIKEGMRVDAEAWKPNGEKCPFTNLKNGNGVSANYYENGQIMVRENFMVRGMDLIFCGIKMDRSRRKNSIKT